jgi:S1-C subfamily serine protease
VGKEVAAKIIRQGKEMELRVKVGELKEEKEA